MPKLMTIVGATGNQGHAVIAALQDDPAWTIRGTTRDVSSPASQALQAKGVEMVHADLDSIDSLKAAFEGSHAIYGVTAFDPADPKIEATWATNIARAAEEIQSLEHFIWSTLPDTAAVSDGRYDLVNFAMKNRADEYIRSKPALLSKTTFLLIGQYHTNFGLAPLSAHRLPEVDSLVHFSTHAPETPIYWIGDVKVNLAPFIKPILEQADKTRGVAVLAHSEVLSAEDSLQLWARQQGEKVVTVPVSPDVLHKLFGMYGDVLGTMWRYWQDYTDKSWTYPGLDVLDRDDLGVSASQMVSLGESFKTLKM